MYCRLLLCMSLLLINLHQQCHFPFFVLFIERTIELVILVSLVPDQIRVSVVIYHSLTTFFMFEKSRVVESPFFDIRILNSKYQVNPFCHLNRLFGTASLRDNNPIFSLPQSSETSKISTR